MKLITRIEIEGFRSIVTGSAEPLGDFTCFVGANNSGKSNILRALSLFFTGQIEPGVSLDFGRDYHANPKSRKKKAIGVSVSFSLPDFFRFREGLEEVANMLGKEFTIRKTWTLFQPEPQAELARADSNFQPVSPAIVKQFTNLINFRYIPNRTVPAQVLRAESSAFQAYVRRRLGLRRKGIKADDLLERIRETASEVVSQANKSLMETTDSLRKLEMSIPLEIASLIQVSGFRAEIQTSAWISDDAWGAGTQAYTMFQLLKLIDTDFSRDFGWRQAAIWAVEEPESSLHKDLEQKLAISLREWSEDNRLRMEILATTHSEIFITAASEGFLVELGKEGSTSIVQKEIPILVHSAATMGISGPVEPVLCFLLDPVVLVEGPLDRRILTHVAQQIGIAPHCKFVSLHELDPVQAGAGADEIVQYLKRYGPLIQNRSDAAPLIVLFDWDVNEQKLHKARQYYGDHADLRVMRMNAEYADPKISSAIRGIERFYPTELFHAAREADKLGVAVDQDGNISVEKEKLKRVKSTLADMLCQAPDKAWYRHLQQVLGDVQNASSIVLGDQIKLHL